MRKLSLIFFAFTFVFGVLNASYNFNRAKSPSDSTEKKIILNNSLDSVLWVGSGFPDEFNSCSIKSDRQKDLAIERGVKFLEKEASKGSKTCQSILAAYFYEWKEDYKKAVYWAIRGAEQGDGACFFTLGIASNEGNGAILDFEEGIKWMFLAAAAGFDEAKGLIKDLEELNKGGESEWYIRAREKAQKWIADHPNAFRY